MQVNLIKRHNLKQQEVVNMTIIIIISINKTASAYDEIEVRNE